MKKSNFLNFLLVTSLFIYLYFAYKNELIPFRYQIIALLLIGFFVFLGILIRKKLVKVLVILMVVLISLLHLEAQSILSTIFVSTNDQAIIKKANVSIVALKERDLKENDLEKAYYGTSDELDLTIYEYIRQEIATTYETVPVFLNKINYNELTNSLLNGEIDIMILDENKREDILEEYPGFNEVTTVIKTFKKDIILESTAKKVNPIKDSFIILLSGADNWGVDDEENRSDVNILAIVNPRIDHIMLVSIPRDTYLPLSCGNNNFDKLTHAGFYSQECVQETIENFLDIEINYNMKVNFSGLLHVINIIGGSINVYNPYAFQGHTEEYYFEEGCLSLDGLATLNYVRTRYELPDGDFGRQENQKRVIKSLLKKMTSPHRILNMGAIFKSLSEVVETNVDVKFVNRFISNQLDKWPNWQLSSLPVEGYDGMETTYSFPNQELYVFITYPEKITDLSKNISKFMDTNSIESVNFMQKENIPESLDSKNIDIESSEVEQDPIYVNDIYRPIIHNDIYKFGTLIKPFDLEGQENFTKLQYIEACEASYSW